MILELAEFDDAPAIAALRTQAAAALTERFGKGHWSHASTEKGVRWDMRRSSVYVIRSADAILGSLCLATRKPWAIDVKYFTAAKKPLYLLAMAVAPAAQGGGIGHRLIEGAVERARQKSADFLRLDAYDAEAGAGGFYKKCGFSELARVSYKGTPLIYFERAV